MLLSDVAMSQLNRVRIVRTDFPKTDEGIQICVKLKGLKNKKKKRKRINKKQTK
jgi:hypothetical protein